MTKMKTKAALIFIVLLVFNCGARADGVSQNETNHSDDNLPAELKDIDQSSRKDGFAELFDSYNPRGFSLYTASIGVRTNSGLEYFSGNSIYGGPGPVDSVFYKTKQNLYYEPASSIPFDLSAQAVYSTDAYPIYRLGVRWKVSATPAFKKFFEKLHLAYSVNYQPVQIDSIPGYNWQVEHIYQINFPDFLCVKGLLLRGVFDQAGGRADDSTLGYSSQLVLPVFNSFSAFSELKYSRDYPGKTYNGTSFGLEYRLPF
jgi:hypothetical protein